MGAKNLNLNKISDVFSKILLRTLLYVFKPENCNPRVIHVEGKDYYLLESEEPGIDGKNYKCLSYVTFENLNETVYLVELKGEKSSTLHREMHRYLWKLCFQDNVCVFLTKI